MYLEIPSQLQDTSSSPEQLTATDNSLNTADKTVTKTKNNAFNIFDNAHVDWIQSSQDIKKEEDIKTDPEIKN